jgi:hypothetical protein
VANRRPGCAAGPEQGNSVSTSRNSGPTELVSVGSSIPHSSFDPFHDQTALKLRHGSQDGTDHFAGRRRGVHPLAETHKRDAERVERLQRPEQVRDGPGEAVKLPDTNHIKLALVRVGMSRSSSGPSGAAGQYSCRQAQAHQWGIEAVLRFRLHGRERRV